MKEREGLESDKQAHVRNFSAVRRIVIKVGTSLLRKADAGVDRRCIKNIAEQIAGMRSGSARVRRQIVLVSSGAVGFGMLRLGLTRRPADVATLQAVAAIGQPELMQAWADAFSSHGIRVSQLLLTIDGLRSQDRFLNATDALLRIPDLKVVPIVNENDTVAVEELTFGDNDRLSALVAAMIDADMLVNLTDVDGVKDSDGNVLHTVPLIRREWIKTVILSKRQSGFTVGGMGAKLNAAQIALQSGIPVVIANGRTKKILTSILNGDSAGTLFLPKKEGLKGKKIWLSLFPAPEG